MPPRDWERAPLASDAANDKTAQANAGDLGLHVAADVGMVRS